MGKDYIWNLSDLKDVKKNGCKVFTTFSCGGGSSMGYKLAGYEVLGNCEIDPQINAMYVKNHHPKYNFLMGVQDFYKEENIPNIPQELYDIDVLDGSPPCFAAGTRIKTENGYKNVEDIAVGDEVLTHKGRFRKVLNTMQKDSDNCYSLKIMGLLPITVTGNHPFLVRTMKRYGKKGERAWGEQYWKSVEELTIKRNSSNEIKEQDYVGIPVNQKSEFFDWSGVDYEHHIYGKKTIVENKNVIDVSNIKFWYLVGKYVGDGWRRKDRKVVIICCGKKDIEELKNSISNGGFKATYAEEKDTYKANINSSELYAFLEMFGDGATNKKIPECVLNMPEEQLKSFLDGYMSTDGHVDNNGVCRISSVSLDLILGVQQIIAKIYKQATTITTKENNGLIQGRKCNCHRAYDIAFRREKRKQQHAIYENGYLWVPYREKEKLCGINHVYNMSVEEDESYTVNNVAVHNCSVFSVAGGREKYWGKEKHFREGQAKQVLDDLFFEFLNVAQLLKPKVIVAENVKGLIAGNAKGYVNLIFNRLNEIGYEAQLFLLNAATMGVPQKRERTFFIARRKDFKLPSIKLVFNEKPITYGEFAEEGYRAFSKDTKYYERWNKRIPTDEAIGDTVKRTENGKLSGFTMAYLKKQRVSPTLTAHGDALIRFDKPGYPSERDIKIIQTFPQDYDFNGNSVNYVCGMSVPPIMMKRVAEEVYKQLLSKIGENTENV